MGWRKVYLVKTTQKRVGKAVLILGQKVFEQGRLSEIDRGDCIMINLQEDIMILTVYVPNKSVKILETKTDGTEKRNRQIHYYNFRLYHSSVSNSQIKKAEKNCWGCRWPEQHYKQFDLIDIYVIFHPTRAEYTSFPIAN